MKKSDTEKEKEKGSEKKSLRTKDSGGLSDKLRELRTAARYSQNKVAEILGVSQQTYSNYEKRDQPVGSDMIIKLCKLYGITADELLGLGNQGKDERTSVRNDLGRIEAESKKALMEEFTASEEFRNGVTRAMAEFFSSKNDDNKDK